MSSATIEVIHGDITRQKVDAIVNAANATLLGGGGVDGAIHRAAGKELGAFTAELGGCKTGQAKSSPSFALQSQGIQHIIHTVGPIWPRERNEEPPMGHCKEDISLALCYTNSLQEAVRLEGRSIAFPCISTGVYGFPKQRAAEIAVGHVRQALTHLDLDRVVFCCFIAEDAALYGSILDTV